MPGPSHRPRNPVRLDVEYLDARDVPAAGFSPDRVLVTLADGANAAAVTTAIGRSPAVSGVTPLGFGVLRADLAAGVSVEQGTASLAGLGGIVTVQPDYKLTVEAVPTDPGYSGQWALARASAPAAWTVTTGTGQTIVAVIDSGVDTSHPDLAANIWRNPGEIAGNGLDDDGNGYVDDVNGYDFARNLSAPTDDLGHGTHVAGIIGAVGNNGVGVSGVSWQVRIMALKFMAGSDGGYTSDAVRAMDYAVANGAKVINQSWGGGAYDGALAAATGRARAAGVIVVSSAGNLGSNNDSRPYYPASYSTQFDNVITVAATDQNDRLAGYSNFGADSVTLAAPGSGISSTLPNDRYGLKSGTSMAAPFVSGAVALLWDKNPTWSYQQVVAKLRASVDTLPALAGKVATGGRINLAKLLDAPAVSPPVTPPTVPPPAPAGAGPRVVDAVIGGPRAGTFDRAWVKFSSAVDPNTLAGGVSFAGPGGAVGVSAVRPVAGTGNTQFTLVFSRAQAANGTYTLAVGPAVRGANGVALDQNGNGTAGEPADVFTRSATIGPVTGPPTVPPVSPPPVPAPAPATRDYPAAGLPVPIPDRRTTRVNVFVPDSFPVTGLGVQLDLTHARTSDLQIRLTAPDGRRVILFNRRGSGANLANTLFTDAGRSLTAASAPFAGTFKPEQPLSGLVGMNARGTWTVEIFDLADGAAGTLAGVSLKFAGNGVPSAATARLDPASLFGATDATADAVLNGRADRVRR